MRYFTTGLWALALLFSGGTGAKASHLNLLTTVDGIDYVFGAGGGSYLVNISSFGDDSYTTFAANAGDVITIRLRGSNSLGGTIDDPVLGLLLAAGNGMVEAGDVIGAAGVEVSDVGAGADLTILAASDDSTGSLDSLIAGFVIAQTGVYAIYSQSFNETLLGTMTLELSGNTAGAANAPEPASAVLAGLGLAAGFTGYRRRQQAARPRLQLG